MTRFAARSILAVAGSLALAVVLFGALIGGTTPAPREPATREPAPLTLWYTRAESGAAGPLPVARGSARAYPHLPTVEERIGQRVQALWGSTEAPSGSRNVFAGPAPITVSVKVDGDLAMVEIGGTTWGYVATDADVRGLVEQLVFTVTEEPGIRRVKVTEPGKDHVLILTGRGLGGGMGWHAPLTREQITPGH